MTLQRPRRHFLPLAIRQTDRKAGRILYDATAPRLATTGFRYLSSASEKGWFWVAVAGIMAATGASGRRASLRGAGSLVVASSIANLIGKNLIRAPRPRLRGIRHRGGHLRTPSSTAFPSGHSATAAAYATGVALTNPRRGSIVVVLAILVAASRLYVGVHWLSDVIAGNALGVSVGLLGKLLIRQRT